MFFSNFTNIDNYINWRSLKVPVESQAVKFKK